MAILAIKGWWWPGILVLIAISMILEAVLMQFAPHAFEEEQPSTPPVAESTPPAPETSPAPVSSPAPPPAVEHHLELLPSICAKCGAPIRGHEVKWTGPKSADCPYCGASLEMKS
jgi:hypothetical protein